MRGRWLPLLIFTASFLGLLAAESVARQSSPFGWYLHPWNSDVMMQATSIANLKTNPFQSILCHGFQPPALDAIRAFLALFVKSGTELLLGVDKLMYLVWALFYSLLNMLVFHWLARITASQACALIGAAIWALHPACLHFSVMLESTLLSSLLVTWMLYVFQREFAKPRLDRRLELAAMAVFYTRTVFQWYFFPFFFLAARLGGLEGERVKRLAKFCALAAFPLVLKQFVFFHTLSTTTFEGDHKLGLIWYKPPQADVDAETMKNVPPPPVPPFSLARIDRLCSPHAEADVNDVNLALFQRRLRTNPWECIEGVKRSIALNAETFWRPSSNATVDYLTTGLAWKIPYDILFSGWCFISLLLGAFATWCLRLLAGTSSRDWRAPLGLGLVVAYVFTISNLSNRVEWTEADRLKFFLEPAFFVFILSQAWLGLRELAGAFKRMR